MGSWNPVKELKGNQSCRTTAVTSLRWNPVKELKDQPEDEADGAVNDVVESGEGIESQVLTHHLHQQ